MILRAAAALSLTLGVVMLLLFAFQLLWATVTQRIVGAAPGVIGLRYALGFFVA